MIKNDVAVIGIGLGGTKVGYEFQKRNYKTYLVNGRSRITARFPVQRISWY